MSTEVKNNFSFMNKFGNYPQSRVITEEAVFCEDSKVSQKVLEDWYKNKKYSEYKCAICGQEPIWQGKELTLILDHIDGVKSNNILENLRWVCPHCNSQLTVKCEDCGKEIAKGSKKCKECLIKSFKQNSILQKKMQNNQTQQKMNSEQFQRIKESLAKSNNPFLAKKTLKSEE